jgi:hypothetical protein
MKSKKLSWQKRKELEDQEIAKRAKKVMKKASPIKKKKKAKK